MSARICEMTLMEHQRCAPYKNCDKRTLCFPEDHLDDRAITYPSGTPPCKVMFVGRAPSRSEYDFQKRKLERCRPALNPSEGSEAAKLLGRVFSSRIFKELDFDFSKAYFTNLVKCTSMVSQRVGARNEGRPINCYPFLQTEIKKVKPEKTIAFGRDVQGFLKKHGHDFEEVYHPSFILRGGYLKGTHTRVKEQDYAQLLKKALE